MRMQEKYPIFIMLVLLIFYSSLGLTILAESQSLNPTDSLESIQISSFVSTVLLPTKTKHSSRDWLLGSQFPIIWETNDPISSVESGKGDLTHVGKAVFIFGALSSPSICRIIFYGNHQGLRSMRISSEDFFQDYPNISAAIATREMSLSLYKCSKETESFNGNVVYSINALSKQTAWLREGWYCKPMGEKAGWCSIDLELFYYQDDADRVTCKGQP